MKRIGLGAFSHTAIYKNKANWDENVLYFDKCLLEANSDHLSGNYTIKDGTRLIADGAFSACKNLTGIIIPSSVISIGSRAFWGCRGLTDVMIPDGVESIGENAFYSCENITDVTIPKSATSIDSYAFHCCNLKTITVDPANPVYDSRNNCNAIIETKSNSLIIACSNTVIPEGVTSISDYAFSSCKALTSVSIPESVTTIGKCAFSNCSSLNGIIIPNSVKKIGKMAFSSTDSLKEMTIPMNCIGESLFGDKDLAIIMKVTRPGKETKRVVAVFRKQCPNKGREYKKSFIMPLDESAIQTYDALVANGSYDKFKMPADDRIRAAIWRLQDDEFPVTEDTKTAFANFLTSKLTKALQLAEEDAAPSYIETLCSDCNLEEKHISKIKKAVSASQIQDIKALENKLGSMI